MREAGGARAREHEQLVDEQRHALDLGERVVGDVLPVRGLARLAARDLEVRRDHRERRAQLVRGVGRELALRGDAALDAREHAVERVGELVERDRWLALTGRRSSRCSPVIDGGGGDHVVEPLGRASA